MMEQDLIKKPNVDVGYTKFQLSELVKCAMPGISEDYGVVYFIRNYVRIQTVKGERPFDLFDFQIRMLDAYCNNRWAITLTSRQVGKTTLSAAYILWKTIFTPDFFVLIASITGDDAKDINLKIKFAYECLPDWIRPGTREYNVKTITFDNGSRIKAECTTEKTGRGKTPNLLYLDEMAFLPPNIIQDFWAAILPGISTGGSIIITSTPNTDSDKFSELWHGAIAETNGFHPTIVNWDEHPDRTPEFKADMISKLGLLTWKREYENQFLSDSETLISAMRMSALLPIEPIGKKNNFRFWDTIKSSQRYVIGVDVGTGTGGDYSTIQCFTFPQLVQVAELRENTLSTPQLTIRLVWLLTLIEKQGAESYYSIESNGVGEGVIAAIEQIEDAKGIEIPGNMFHDIGKGRRGYFTTARKKLASCMSLKALIDTDNPRILVKSKFLLNEFKFYVRAGASFAAKLGMHDDLIAGLLIMIRVSVDASEFDDVDVGSVYDDDDYDIDLDDDDAYGIVF